MPPLKIDIDTLKIAVNEYVNMIDSVKNICLKYKISQPILRKYAIKFGYEPRQTTVYSMEKIKEAIVEYLNTDKSFKAVGEKYKISQEIVRHWLIKLGHTPRKIHTIKNIKNFQKMKSCVEEYKSGIPTKKLALKYNISRRTVMNWCQTSGVYCKKFNETLGINKEMKEKAIDLYVNQNLNCTEISKIIPASNRSIYDWVKDVRKSASEIACNKIFKKGNNIVKGLKGDLSTRFGKIYFSSSYERDRILQLENDCNVVNLTRCQDFIKYKVGDKTRGYLPDLFVEYSNGIKVVEEIKPFVFIKQDINRLKFREAKIFYKDKGIKFRVVTELLIYEKSSLRFDNRLQSYVPSLKKNNKLEIKWAA